MEKILLYFQNIVQAFHLQYLERFIADLRHHRIEAAGGLVLAFFAGFIIVEADAGKQCDGAVKKPDHCRKGNVFGILYHIIASPFSFFTPQKPGFFQFQEDVLQKFMGYAVLAGYFIDKDRAFVRVFEQ